MNSTGYLEKLWHSQKGCSVHSRSLLEVILGGIIMLDSHFLAVELHIQLSVLGFLEEFQGSQDVCSFTEPVVLLLSNHMALLQPWSVLMDSQFPMSTRHAVLVPLNISVLLVYWEILQQPFGGSWCNMPGSILLFSISFPLTKVQVIEWLPLLVVESMFKLQVHLLVVVSYMVIQMKNVTNTKYLEPSWDPG